MDARLFSEVEPTDVYTGRIWIKPSTATAYMRLGSTWVSLGSAGDLVTYQRVTILIDNVDVTSLIEKDSLNITDVLTVEVDTCTFRLLDSTGSSKPIVGQEVLVFYKETSSSTPEIRFAGYITEVPQSQFAQGKYVYEVMCVDYTQELNKHLVVETYERQTAGYIIKDIISKYAKTLGSFYVQDGPIITFKAFNYKYPMECLEELAGLTGYDWYVDYERNVHFFIDTTTDASLELNETASTGEFKELVVTVMKEELQNTITVRGGFEFSALFTQEKVADGTQDSFALRYKSFSPISVFVDIGGGYVQKTLGIDNIDTSGVDFIYNAAEKVVKNLDYAVLTAGHKLKVTYRYKKPILALIDDDASIELMKQLEGGDGVYEGPLIVDETIETKKQAQDRGHATLNQYSNPLIEGSFITTQFGYKSGQLLTINLPSRGINAQYLIRQVSATSLGMGNFEYEVTFGTTLKGLTEYLIQLHKASSPEFERTGEILARLKIAPDDGYAIADSGLAYSKRNTTTDPYKWSNDGGTTLGKGQYGLVSFS